MTALVIVPCLESDFAVTTYIQYYVNRKGVPLSNDFIVYEKSRGREKTLMWSYYYQYSVLLVFHLVMSH